MPRILHFADAHIDIANHGRRDPASGLPLRVLDFLASLDEIIDTAISEEVDCVIFAGDAYKDQNPAPTFQREWGRRIMRLSQAGIPTILLVGNHDLSPALGRAHALAEFNTLQAPHILTVDQPYFYSTEALSELCPSGKTLDFQLITLPWISRSAMAAALDLQTRDTETLHQGMEEKLTRDLNTWLEEADPDLPVVLAAHASVEGAILGGERTVSLGRDLILPKALAADPRLDYTALGHIHKNQNLNPDGHPPVVYPGSIERVNFGEAGDEKYYVIAEVTRGETRLDWRQLENIRPFVDIFLEPESSEQITDQVRQALPEPEDLEGAVVRLVLSYPRAWEPLLNEAAILELGSGSLQFNLIKQPQLESRIRLPEDRPLGSLSPRELLDQYWELSQAPVDEVEELNRLAEEIFHPEEGE